MNNPSDNLHIDSHSQLTDPTGRYDKFQEAGKSTRFIKGASGNPRGRPKKQPRGELAKFYCKLLG
jgi:hypothetical protein